MFDYTTKDGILRVYEAANGFYISLRNGETFGMGDGVDSMFDALFEFEGYDDYTPEGREAELRNYRKMSPEQIGVTIEHDKWELIRAYFNYEPGDEDVMTDDELLAHYRAEIEDWDWAHLKREAIANRENSEDGSSGFTWVGSYYALCPSGKVYAFWTSNQSSWDEIRDSIWWEAFEDVASEHGMWQTDGGESDHLYLGCDLPAELLEDEEEGEEEDAD